MSKIFSIMNYHRIANAGIKLPLLKSLRNGIFHNCQFQVLIDQGQEGQESQESKDLIEEK